MGVPPVPLLLNPAGAVIAVGVVSFFVLKEVNRRARAEARAREKTRRAKAEARRAEAEQDSSSDSDQETHYESDDSDEDEDSESGGSQTDASDDADEALESLLKQWARYLVNRVVHIATTLLRKMALAMLNGRAVLRVNKESGTLNQRRRCKAERRFFDPRRNRNQQSLLELLRKIIETRYREQDAEPIDWSSSSQPIPVEPVSLAEVSGRMLITAERLFQQIVLFLSRGEPRVGLPVAFRNLEFRTAFGPWEVYKSGHTYIYSRHRTDACSPPAIMRADRLGASYVKWVGSYGQILDFFEDLLSRGILTTEYLIHLLIQFSRYHIPVESDGRITRNMADDLNRIFFLLTAKEQAQWQSSIFFKWSEWDLGMAVTFARIVLLLKKGALTLRDVFGPDAPYALYCLKDMYRRNVSVRVVCKKVDRLYGEVFGRPTTAEQAHQDLREVYGGSGESDSDDYSDCSEDDDTCSLSSDFDPF